MGDLTALVLGAGNFGKVHARILAQHPDVGKIILTSRAKYRAEQKAVEFARELGTPDGKIVGVKVATPRELGRQLGEHGVGYVSITAKDPQFGEAIHPEYVFAALDHHTRPHVLCEKPFSSATGDGTSIGYARMLENPRYRGRFGLELPAKLVIEDAVANDIGFRIARKNAEMIKMHWAFDKPGKTDAYNALAAHPLSMLPAEYELTKARIRDEGSNARLYLKFKDGQRDVKCHIYVGFDHPGDKDPEFLGVSFDGNVYEFHVQGPETSVIARRGTKLARTRQMELGPEIISTTINPVGQMIDASLRGEPIVEGAEAYKLQEMLEKVRGYKG